MTDIMSVSLGLICEKFEYVIDSGQLSRLVYNHSFESDQLQILPISKSIA